MQLLNIEKFFENIGRFNDDNLKLENYVYKTYTCTCGKQHTFDSKNNILFKSGFKLVLVCPEDDKYVTCVKIKHLIFKFGFMGFQTLLGTEIDKKKREHIYLKNIIQAKILTGR